jgi:ATP-dependent Lon protease
MKDTTGSEERIANPKEEGGRLADSIEYEVPAILSDNLVLFPRIEIVTVVRDERSLSALREALKQHQILAHIPSSSRVMTGTIGTLAMVKRTDAIESGAGLNVELKGMWRIRVKRFISSSGYPKVQFERADESVVPPSTNASSLMKKVQDEIDEFVRLIPGIPSEIVSLLKHAETPGALADLCANSPEFTHEERVDLLETLDQVERLRRVSNMIEKQLVSLRKIVQVEPISRCEKCMELADRAFDSDPSKMGEIASSFLNHVVQEHTGELLALLAEKYGPIFLNKRALR